MDAYPICLIPDLTWPARCPIGSAGSTLSHTPTIINLVTYHVAYLDDQAIDTLLSLRLVSHTWLHAATLDQHWQIQLKRQFPYYSGPPIPVKSPTHLIDDKIRALVDQVFTELATGYWQVNYLQITRIQHLLTIASPPLQQIFRQRNRLNKIAVMILRVLISTPWNKLDYLAWLTALGPQVADAIERFMTHVYPRSGVHWLCQRWWSMESIKAIFRVDACKRWRAIDEGEARGVTGTARASAYEDAFASLAWVGGGSRVSILQELDILARDIEAFVRIVTYEESASSEKTAAERQLARTHLTLKLVRERLVLAGYNFRPDDKDPLSPELVGLTRADMRRLLTLPSHTANT